MLLLDVPLSSSTEELEGQTAETAEKRQTQYQRYVARLCLNSALVSRGKPRRPRFQIRNLLRTERSLALSLLFKGFFFPSCTACLSQAIAFSRGRRLHPHIPKLLHPLLPSQVEWGRFVEPGSQTHPGLELSGGCVNGDCKLSIKIFLTWWILADKWSFLSDYMTCFAQGFWHRRKRPEDQPAARIFQPVDDEPLRTRAKYRFVARVLSSSGPTDCKSGGKRHHFSLSFFFDGSGVVEDGYTWDLGRKTG